MCGPREYDCIDVDNDIIGRQLAREKHCKLAMLAMKGIEINVMAGRYDQIDVPEMVAAAIHELKELQRHLGVH